MSTDLERKAERVADELWSQGNLDVIDELYADNCECEFPGTDEPLHGRSAVKEYAEELRTAFPDLELSLDDVISTDDAVAGRYAWTGTHKGEINGIPATDRSVTIDGSFFVKYDDDGLAVQEYVVSDRLSMMEQLGVAPQLST